MPYTKTKRHSKRAFNGVQLVGVKWAASVRVNRRTMYYQEFDSPITARLEYNRAARRYFPDWNVR